MSETTAMYLLHDEHARNLTREAFASILKHFGIKSSGLKEELIDRINENVNEHKIDKVELGKLIGAELRYGHHRNLFIKDLTELSNDYFKSIDLAEINRLIKTKGYEIPSISFTDVHYPSGLHLCEIERQQDLLNFTFARTIYCITDKGGIRKETDFAFVTIDTNTKTFTVRIRPRGNVINPAVPKEKINQNLFYYIIEDAMNKIFIQLDLLKSTHYKRHMYNIGYKLTERAEQKWREMVNEHSDYIASVSDSFHSKLSAISKKEFDINYRLTRLLERALIQSNFEDRKKKEEGRQGWVHSFVFSDDSGGRIKSSTKERSKAIELSELYYDTKDTIDKKKTFDKIWINWFTDTDRIVETRLECTQEYYEILLFSYLKNKEELDNVLSKIRTLAKD